jgi:hypothetical protein
MGSKTVLKGVMLGVAVGLLSDVVMKYIPNVEGV